MTKAKQGTPGRLFIPATAPYIGEMGDLPAPFAAEESEVRIVSLDSDLIGNAGAVKSEL